MARVVLTQPLPRVEPLARALVERGHEVLCLSFTRVLAREVDGLEDRLARTDWVVAVSPAALERLAALLGNRWPTGPGLALIGPGSLRALEQSGMAIPPDRLALPSRPPFDASALLRAGPLTQPAGKRVLVVRGDGGRDDWIDQLREAGAAVETLALYDREPIQPDPAALLRLRDWLVEPAKVFCVLTQTGTAARLTQAAGEQSIRPPFGSVVALAIHSRIAEAAAAVGFTRVRLIDPGEDALIAAIE